jgi:hypothetical protein
MSITNLLNKIKDKTGIDKYTLLYLCIIIVVALSSFGLGRLSTNNDKFVKENNTFRKEESLIYNNFGKKDEIKNINLNTESEKKFVASKNGEMYYNVNCSGVSRIKLENMVWFGSKEEAEKSGYKLSSTCKE